MTALSATAKNPWKVRGLIRYEEKDLLYVEKKVQEAVKMDDPEAQRRHLQDVIDLYASKYFVTVTAEGLLEDADLDLVYIQKMLEEAADDPSPPLSCEEVMGELKRKYGL